MSRETRLIKNTMIIAIGNICTKCISFFMLPLYTSILSTTEYGTVDLINVIVSLSVIVLTLQIEQAIFRYLVDARENAEKQKEYITTTIVFIAFVNLICVTLLFAIMQMIDYPYTFYVISTIVLNVIISFLLQIPRGIGNNLVYAIGSFISGSFNVIFNVILIAFLGWRVEGMLLASLIANVTAVIYISVQLRVWRYFSMNCFSIESLKILLAYSLPLIPNTFCWWIISASDRIVINIFLGVGANGIYSVAHKFPSVFRMVSNIFHTSWTESAAENIGQCDGKDYVQEIMHRTIKLYSSANIGIIAMMPFVFPILVGDEFLDSYLYIPLLMTGALFHSVADLYGSLYIALKKTKEIAKTTFLAAIINLVVNILLVQYMGLYAAAISTVFAYATITVVRHRGIRKVMDIACDKRYLFIETIVYAVVFFAYYSQNTYLRIAVFVLLFPYCMIQNQEILIGLFKLLLNRRKK